MTKILEIHKTILEKRYGLASGCKADLLFKVSEKIARRFNDGCGDGLGAELDEVYELIAPLVK